MASSVDIMYVCYIIGLLLAMGLGTYDAYWSLGLRRALRVRAYSRQALIVGLFSVYGSVLFFLFYVTYFLVPNMLNSPLGTLQEALYAVLPPIAFAWIDTSIRVGRRTDPLLRDPLQWSRVRLVLWPLLLLSLLGFFPLRSGLNGTAVFSFVILGISVLPILMAAKWSGDRYYRRSLEWFGFALVALVVQNIGFNTLMPGLGTGLVYSSSGFVWTIFANLVFVPVLFYGIYMCARALVPLNKISLD